MNKIGRFMIIGFVIGALMGALALAQPAHAGGKEISNGALKGVEEALVEKIKAKPVKENGGAVASKSSYSCVSCSSDLWGWYEGSSTSVIRCEDSYRNNKRYEHEYTEAAVFISHWDDNTGEYHAEMIELDPENVTYNRGVLTATGHSVDITCTATDGFGYQHSSKSRWQYSDGYQSQSRYRSTLAQASVTGVTHPHIEDGYLDEYIHSSEYDGNSLCKGDCVGGGKG